MEKPLHVLIVEDVPVYTSLLQHMLSAENFTLEAAATLKEGLEKVKASEFNAVLLDLGLPDSQGLGTFTEFNRQSPEVPIVILSGLGDEEVAAAAVQMGAQDYLVKGTYLTKGEAGKKLLVHSLRYAIERKQQQIELLNERDSLERRVAERTFEINQANQKLLLELAERKRIENALTESEAKNTALINALPDFICRLNFQGMVVDFKIPYSFASLLPAPEWFIGKHFNEAFPADLVSKCLPHYKEALKTGKVQITEYDLQIDHTTYNMDVRVLVSQEAEILFIGRDVTERKAAEDKIHKINEHLRIMQEMDRATLGAKSSTEITLVGLIHFDRLVPNDYSSILFVNQAQATVTLVCERSDGQICQRLEQAPVAEFMLDERLRDKRFYLSGDLNAQADLSPFETRLRQDEIHTLCMIPMIAEQNLIGVINLARRMAHSFTAEQINSLLDASRQLAMSIHNAQLFEQVSAGRERLHLLTDRLVSVQEDERRRISLELHDEAGQALTALKLNLALIQSDIPSQKKKVRQQLTEAINLTHMTMELVRGLAHNLHPPSLEAIGLNQAMEDYCLQIARKTGINVKYSGMDLADLPRSFQLSLYRALQEALTNVIRHSGATITEVKLYEKDNLVCLSVEDNGCGFAAQAPGLPGKVEGLGLLGISERIETLGGSFEVISQPGEGTTLHVCIPRKEEI